MENLPIYISIGMIFSTLLAVFLFYKATKHSNLFLIVVLLWLTGQGFISLQEFYTVTDSLPPRLTLLVAPPFIFIVMLFLSPKGRRFIDQLDPKFLTILHVVRIPVEVVLFWLFLHKTIPQLMTFEGRNFDILSGVTAPLVFYYGFITKRISRNTILFWNFFCLALLINIVMHAIFSAPFPFQQLAFDQPNIAVLYFPFVWLPGCIVPLVLFSHVASIRQLLKSGLNNTRQ